MPTGSFRRPRSQVLHQSVSTVRKQEIGILQQRKWIFICCSCSFLVNTNQIKESPMTFFSVNMLRFSVLAIWWSTEKVAKCGVKRLGVLTNWCKFCANLPVALEASPVSDYKFLRLAPICRKDHSPRFEAPNWGVRSYRKSAAINEFSDAQR